MEGRTRGGRKRGREGKGGMKKGGERGTLGGITPKLLGMDAPGCCVHLGV